MNRRAFLTSLFGASAAVALLPTAELLASPVYEPLYLKSWDDTFQKTLEEAWRMFTAHHGDPMPVVIDEGEMFIGHVIRGRTLTNQLSVDCAGELRLVDLAMRALSDSVKRHQLTLLGALRLPSHVVFAGRFQGLRMVIMSNPEDPADLLTRFDVIGATPEMSLGGHA